MPIVRVVIVDDQLMLGDVLAVELSVVPDLVLLARYSTDDPALLSDVTGLQPDVITVDVGPLGSRGPSLVRSLRCAVPASHVVVLTGSDDADLAVQVARAGASAWVDKAGSTAHLIEVLRGVCTGASWYPPQLLGAVLRWVAGRPERRESIHSSARGGASPHADDVVRLLRRDDPSGPGRM